MATSTEYFNESLEGTRGVNGFRDLRRKVLIDCAGATRKPRDFSDPIVAQMNGEYYKHAIDNTRESQDIVEKKTYNM